MLRHVFSLAVLFSFLISNGFGRILELDERFRDAKYNGEWLVMFYAPWCGHCKQLEPTWMEIGDVMEEILPVHVARLDCTRYSSLSGSFGVRGFPTIKFISGDLEYEYRGARTKNDIIDFAKKARGPKVSVLTAVSELDAARIKDSVFFLYVGEEDDELRKTFDKVATALFLSMNFYATTSHIFPTISNQPTVIVFKDNTHYEMPLSSKTVDALQLKHWMSSEQTSDYSQLTGASYHSLKSTGKLYAVAVLSNDGNEDFENAAKKLALSRIAELRPKFVFCWVKGNAIINQMTYTDIATPNFVVFNAQNYEYFALKKEGSVSSLTGVDELKSFLSDILDGKLTPMGGSGYLQQMGRFFVDASGMIIKFFKDNPIIASLVFGVPTFVVTFLCYCLCTMEDGQMEDEDDEESEYDDDTTEHLPEYDGDNEDPPLRRRNVGSGDGDGTHDGAVNQDTEEESLKDK